MEWDSSETFNQNVVWWNRLDNRFQIEVRRSDEDAYKGELIIFDHDKEDEVIHEEQVGLMYGAMFGPDMADVALWQDKSVEAVDEYYHHDE